MTWLFKKKKRQSVPVPVHIQPVRPSVTVKNVSSSSAHGWSGWDGIVHNPVYVCEACGNEIQIEDHVSVQIGKDNSVYFHKSCYVNPDNQSMIRSLVVAEDVMGI